MVNGKMRSIFINMCEPGNFLRISRYVKQNPIENNNETNKLIIITGKLKKFLTVKYLSDNFIWKKINNVWTHDKTSKFVLYSDGTQNLKGT